MPSHTVKYALSHRDTPAAEQQQQQPELALSSVSLASSDDAVLLYPLVEFRKKGCKLALRTFAGTAVTSQLPAASQ